MTRTAPNLETKLASALYALGLIPFEDARAMGRTNFLSLFDFHHVDPHAEGGSDEFYNYDPMLRVTHRRRTSLIDVPRIAKNKRIQASAAIHQAALASKNGDYSGAARILASAPKPPPPKRKILSRPFPKGHRPMRRQFGERP